ncbi:uncharacterized protein [Gossypium hirsutum]|uniref:Uncharacterized protein isoform X2 n=1 Tax=Gossypium hirsutum TaxID=3635 RepID=A0ABM2ZCD4_GOSHI|nr:uncharacterized protein LOC107924155 isoform X2 [Gossypium hirsutum]
MLLRHTFCSQTVNDTCRSLKSYLASVALDYVFIVLPTLLIFTVLAEWVYICMIGLLFLLIFFTAVKRTYSLPYMEGPNASRASISSYRVVTWENFADVYHICLCILREYAKTETYGTSLVRYYQVQPGLCYLGGGSKSTEHIYLGWEGDGISALYLSQGYVGIHSSGFRNLLLKPKLLRSIVDFGFEHPSEGKVLNSCLMLTFVNSMN